MKASTTALALAGLAARTVLAAQDERTFAVLRFNGGGPLMEGSVDPIVDPGVKSKHVHSVQGASSFGLTVDASTLSQSKCTTAMIGGDNSIYWTPKLYFHDKEAGKFESVNFYYMNVYYFFEPTDDEIVAFPEGLHMFAGDSKLFTLPNGGVENLDPSQGNITAARWTCPRGSDSPPSWPADSDGTTAGVKISDGQGFGFPLQDCDTMYSPLRADIHFPSCYDPSKDLTDYKNNMVYPVVTNWKQNCPEGFIHVPHIFYEVYWDTISFRDRWVRDGKSQPFVLSNGDPLGYSLHGDFIAGWNEDTLKTIIDTCNAGDEGMDKCPNLPQGLNTATDCHIDNPIDEVIDGVFDALPGDNPLKSYGYVAPGGGHGSTPSSAAAVAPSSTKTTAAASTPSSAYGSGSGEGSGHQGQHTSAAASAVPSYVAGAQDVAAGSSDDDNNSSNDTPAAGGAGAEDDGPVTTVWTTVTVTKRGVDASPAPALRQRGHAAHHNHARHHHHQQ
jgi:hypothetical protein